MKNKLIDIHNILVATLEDLDDEEIMKDKDKLNALVKTAEAKCEVVEQIIQLDRLALEAEKISAQTGITISKTLRIGNERD